MTEDSEWSSPVVTTAGRPDDDVPRRQLLIQGRRPGIMGAGGQRVRERNNPEL